MRFSKSQRRILRSQARITLVRATAGSGKTSVFISRFNELLRRWDRRHQGIAAISFTNVAQQVIRQRLGGDPGEPHFIGTLDAFMLRFIIRPFATVLGLPQRGVRLVPAPVHMEHDEPSVRFGPSVADWASLYQVRLPTDHPQLQLEVEMRGRPARPVEPSRVATVMTRKWQHWRETGLITHADSHYLAAQILLNPEAGEVVSQIVSTRFPVILVDELQDTGWFLGLALMALLRNEDITSLLVGDPDQAIFECSGANPRLFNDIEAISGCVALQLPETRRCSRRVVAVAKALSESKAQIRPARVARSGETRLVVHRQTQVENTLGLKDSISALRGPGENIAVLARRGNVVRRLTRGLEPTQGGDLTGGARSVHMAAQLFMDGDNRGASGLVARLLGKLLLKNPAPTQEVLTEHAIEVTDWRLGIYDIIEESVTVVDVPWSAWRDQIKLRIREVASFLDMPVSATGLGSNIKIPAALISTPPPTTPFPLPKLSATTRRPLTSRGPISPDEMVVSTVHGVKGREFDCVAYYFPKPHATRAPCPSGQWWQPSSEEKRIAFVAASRARRAFALYVHEDTYAAFEASQPDFVELLSVSRLD